MTNDGGTSSGGASAATGGASASSGGAVMSGVGGVSTPSSGGAMMATGGAMMATGGAMMATGGAMMATGGAMMATGGAMMATGGSTSGGGNGVLLESTCYPICADASSDDDGDDWGWENEESCVVSGSATAQSGSNCDGGGGNPSGGNTGSGGNTSTGGTTGSGQFDCSNPGGGSCPAQGSFSCPGNATCGCYSVNGLGANKCKLLNAGAEVYMLASAMMETENMDGDSYAEGDNKSGDAYNSGTCKQNWGMMRVCYDPWTQYGANDYQISRPMRTDAALDVAVYSACRSYYGSSWWAGHRNGSSGLQNPNTQDIQEFKQAMDWTSERIQGHETDDIRFWVDVAAIIP